MSINLVRKNSSSPFRLQRSIVDQGGEGGAYESGGYTGQSQYSDGGMSNAIASFGKVVGAEISSRTASDKNDANIKKEARLKERSSRIKDKKEKAITAGDTERADRLDKRNKRVEARKEKTTAEITKYNESQKPTLKSDIKTTDKKESKAIPSAVAAKTTEERKESVAASTTKLLNSGTITKSEEEKKKDRENEIKRITPLNQKKKIVEKDSYEKGKVEKYTSKSAMEKHEKKETKSFEKKEGKKPSPTKMKKC